MGRIYQMVKSFKKRYPNTIAWRIKKHAAVLDGYIDDDEKLLYAFCGQNNNDWYDVTSSCAVALTSKRLLIGQKRVVWGSFYTQVTPDMYNDMHVYSGLFWGKIYIDTIKETVVISNLDKKSLDEIETAVSKLMLKEKRKYRR
ncbi:MAG: hypothetical protein GX951_02530 [Mollicutes bacterium]|nr:hypothetical protein [Mollicutes bacterium]